MKKYILILFGDFTCKILCEHVESVIFPIVDSKHLKFQNNGTSMIYHFASEVEQSEMFVYIEGSLFDVLNSFILSENNDNLSVYMQPEIKTHLFDLDNNTNYTHINNDLKNNEEHYYDDEDFSEDLVASILNKVKSQIKKPSLNQLLDKINENGVDSLSPYERGVLDEYSKN